MAKSFDMSGGSVSYRQTYILLVCFAMYLILFVCGAETRLENSRQMQTETLGDIAQ
jgi:hypothetical protein